MKRKGIGMEKEVCILIVDDNPDDRTMFSRYLRQAGFKVETADEVSKGIDIASKKEISCILLDNQIPCVSGIEMLKKLKADPYLKFIPVIMLTGLEQEENILQGLDAGADDYVGKSSSPEIIIARVRASIRIKDLQDEIKGINIKLQKANEELIEANNIKTKALEDLDKALVKLKEISIKDSLTKIYNHGYFMEVLEKEFARSTRYKQNICCLMLDIDYFKKTNDTYGHLFGDKVLTRVAECIKQHIRNVDFLARYGGEEFVVLLIDQDYERSFIVAEKVKDSIENYIFKDGNISVRLTVSIGMSSLFEDGILEKEKFLIFADMSLYEAKIRGRNCIVKYQEIADTRHLEGVKSKEIENKIFGIEEISKQSYLESVKTLIITHEQRDPITREHSINVSRYVNMICKEMNLPESEIAVIGNAAILHDLGKIGIYDKILFKKDKLTTEEYFLIKQHPITAVNILRKSNYIRRELDIILYHHERYDGKGYPCGIKGENIPLGSRIIAVADSYDAMRSNRPYRDAMSLEYILDELVNNIGSQFDPEVVKAFINTLSKNGLIPASINIQEKLKNREK